MSKEPQLYRRRTKHGALGELGEIIHVVSDLTKFKQTMLLLLSMYTAFIAAGGLYKPLYHHVLLWLLGYLAVGSTTALNMYFDRDIDALMPRTSGRVLPSGLVSPLAVFYASLVAFIASVIVSTIYVNAYFAMAIVIGFVFDIGAYTLMLKRRTPLSIIAGAVAGGAPALGGWAAGYGTISAPGLLFSLLVSAWVPSHIWFLASYYKDDYRRANVPMLPVVADPASIGTGIGLGALVMGYVSLSLWSLGTISVITAIYGLLAASHIFYLAVKYIDRGGDKAFSFKAFKYVNIHLGVFFLLIILEKVLQPV